MATSNRMLKKNKMHCIDAKLRLHCTKKPQCKVSVSVSSKGKYF